MRTNYLIWTFAIREKACQWSFMYLFFNHNINNMMPVLQLFSRLLPEENFSGHNLTKYTSKN